MFLSMLFVGIIVSIPVGPVSLLCIKKTLHHGILAGLIAGLGAALADVIYAIFAALGASALHPFLTQHQKMFKMACGVLLLFLGLQELRHGPVQDPKLSRLTTHSIILKSFFLTAANPLSILNFIGIFSVLNYTHLSLYQLLSVISGIFSGSMLWWLFLCKTAQSISLVYVKMLYLLSCCLLIGFGLWILIWA